MKHHIKQSVILVAIVLATACFLSSCEKADSKGAFGFTNIFIPQSTVSGGVNLNYLVPSGLDTNTFNYKIDTKNSKVNVYLGIARSGQASADSYSVSVTAKPDTITQLIGNGLIMVSPNPTKTVVLLPAGAYTLPATVTVPQGQTIASFNLAIDLAQLKTFAGKKVALCVAISNPSKYTLSPTNSKVVVIIDVDALKLP
jgi:hypothetical protein